MRAFSGFSGGGSFLFFTAVTAFSGDLSSLKIFTSSPIVSIGPEDAGSFVDIDIMKFGCPFVDKQVPG